MIPFASAFVMRDDHGNRRFAADPKRLFERVGDAIAFVAHVRAVHGAGRGQSSGEFDHLFGWCTDRRCIIEPRAHARRPGIESGFQALAHERPLGGAGWAAHVRHRANPQRRVADQADGVDRRGVAIERAEVGGEAGEESRRVPAQEVERRRWPAVARERCEADAAIAGDDRGHALADLGRHRRIGQEGAVIVAMNVDEAGRECATGGVDGARSLQVHQMADRRNALVDDGDVGVERGATRAVDDPGVADDQVGSAVVRLDRRSRRLLKHRRAHRQTDRWRSPGRRRRRRRQFPLRPCDGARGSAPCSLPACRSRNTP